MDFSIGDVVKLASVGQRKMLVVATADDEGDVEVAWESWEGVSREFFPEECLEIADDDEE